MKTLKYFSMFSGIGGFELGIERAAAGHGIPLECVGYSEIDKYAIQTYERHWPEHVNFGDAKLIDPDTIPDFDLLAGGFPCQAFSIAGNRRGFDEARGTLFFDIARILERKRPRHFILENVKGLLSHDGGRTIRVIIQTLTDLGYCVEWQVLNCKDFGPPQNRERIVIVGHLGGLRGRAVFPLTGEGNPYSPNSVSAETAVARTLTAGGNSGGNHSGMTVIAENAPLSLSLQGVEERRSGRSSESCETTSRGSRRSSWNGLTASQPPSTPTIGKAWTTMEHAPELQRFLVVQDIRSGLPKGVFQERERVNTLKTNYSTGFDNHGAKTGVAEVSISEERVRRLTELECERLQGFPDVHTEGVSGTQRYRQCGNAVPPPMIEAVAFRLFEGWS